jgi:hypothetical protein
MRPLEGPQRRAVRNVEASQIECSAAIVAATGVELRSVIGKCQPVPLSNPERAACICVSAVRCQSDYTVRCDCAITLWVERL